MRLFAVIFPFQALCSGSSLDSSSRSELHQGPTSLHETERDLGSVNYDQGTPSLDHEDDRKRFERREARLRRREGEQGAGFIAVAKTPGNDDDDRIKSTQKFLEDLIGSKEMVIMKNAKTDKVDGWGALQLDEDGVEKVKEHPEILRVQNDSFGRKRRSLPKLDQSEFHEMQNQTLNGLNSITKRAEQWIAQRGASQSLRMISWPEDEEWEVGEDLLDYIYERPAGTGINIYIIEEGIQLDVSNGAEFPNKDLPIQSALSQIRAEDDRTDEASDSHGTSVASVALSRSFGVAKGANLISAKFSETLSDAAAVGRRVLADIEAKGRQKTSIVVSTYSEKGPSDQSTVLEDDLNAIEWWNLIGEFHEIGVPFISPAGNDAKSENRPNVDFWPSYFASEDIPVIVVAEVDIETAKRTPESQGGSLVTTWAPSGGVKVLYRDGSSNSDTGTSFGCGLVAGFLATWMTSSQPKWDDSLKGLDRVQAIWKWLKNGDLSGRSMINNGQRVIWNGATLEDHEDATSLDEGPVCNDLADKKYISGNQLAFQIREVFCPYYMDINEGTAVGVEYLEGTPEHFAIDAVADEVFPDSSEWPDEEDCRNALMDIVENCNTEDNEWNFKAGGKIHAHDWTWSITPQNIRAGAGPPEAWCKHTAFHLSVWGANWLNSGFGHELKERLAEAKFLDGSQLFKTDTWNFLYEIKDGHEWRADIDIESAISTEFVEDVIRDVAGVEGFDPKCETD